MKVMLWISSVIDRCNRGVSNVVRWALLANAVLIAGNAFSRKLFAVAEPALYDLQWHFFALIVMLMAAYTLQRDEHVRIDVFSQKLGERGTAWIDLGGIVLVLFPICITMVWLSFPEFIHSIATSESRATRESTSALPAWIIKAFIPAGFFLLGLQGVSEGIRRFAYLRGHAQAPVNRSPLLQD